jgi:hypothetical protein
MITTTTYYSSIADDKETKPKTEASAENNESKEKIDTTIIQDILDIQNDKKSKREPDTTSSDTELEKQFITKEEVQIIAATAIILFLIASIKADFFPSEEQKRLRAINGRNIGITGMSTSFESLAIILLGRLVR